MKYREAQRLLTQRMAEVLDQLAWKIRPKEPVPPSYPSQVMAYTEKSITVETQSEADALNKFRVDGRLDWRVGDTMIVRDYPGYTLREEIET